MTTRDQLAPAVDQARVAGSEAHGIALVQMGGEVALEKVVVPQVVGIEEAHERGLRLRKPGACRTGLARVLLQPGQREAIILQFIERPLPVNGSDDRFAQVLAWVGEDLTQNHSIDALAKRALMSRRNFTRHFRQATGTSVKQWLLNQRLTHAQHLLESSEVSIEVVAQQAGFGSALSLRQHFRTVLRTSPSEYRKLYRIEAGAV